MSHLNSTQLRSKLTQLGSESTQNNKKSRLYGRNTSKLRDRQRRTVKTGFSGKKTTTRSYGLAEDDILSEDNETIRTPKPLFSHEFELLAQKKANLIEEKQKERDKRFARPVDNSNHSRSIMDSSNVRDSSMDRSSDSHKHNQSSHLDRTSFNYSQRSSETDNSEEERRRRERRRKKKEQMMKNWEDPEKDINIILQETETTSLLFIPSMVVTNQNEDQMEVVNASNHQYDKLLELKIGSDNFGEHSSQTMTMQTKPKKIITNIYRENDGTKKVGVEVMEFEILKEAEGENKNEFEILHEEIKDKVELEFENSLKNPYCLLPVDLKTIKANSGVRKIMKASKPNISYHGTDTSKTGTVRLTSKKQSRRTRDFSRTNNQSAEYSSSTNSNTQNSALISQKTKDFGTSLENENKHLIMSNEEFKMIKSDKFKKNLTYVERILNQSKFHKQYVSYRNYPEQDLRAGNAKGANKFGMMLSRKPKEEDKSEDDENRDLKLLLKYQCETLKGRTVSCLDFNSVNTDLLAATYGEHDLSMDNREGYLAFWTLKNPEYPERLIKTSSRAMSCSFSTKNPNLIGVGCYDGVVAIYDIRQSGDKPIADSKELDSKHLDVVWQVGWVGKSSSNDKGEGLISISSDGKIMEWSIKKGLEAQELKLLNRVSNPYMKEESSDAINFRYTTGFSYDFLKNDTIFYFVATEDGNLHRCSKSYKEQYLANYYGHKGPVYKVKCNPFWSEIFLSASADWTCRVWNWREEEEARLVLRNLDLTDEVYDIEWSPYCSTLFASTAKDGRLELWDLYKRQLDPIYVDWDGSKKKEGDLPPRTSVKFNPYDPVLATGNTNGDINIYRIYGYEDFADQRVDEQQKRLEKLLYPTGYNVAQNEDND